MHSIDVRKIAIHLYEYFNSMRKAAKALNNVSVSSICRWCKSLYPKKRICKPIILSEAMKLYIQQLIFSNPSLKCIDIAQKVNKVFNTQISRQLVHIVLKKLNFSYKRIRKRGKSAKKSELTKTFINTMVSVPNNVEVISIDESGFDQRAHPLYGYAPKGKQAILEYDTSNDRNHYSLIMAISSKGTKRFCIQKDTVDSNTFYDFIRSIRIPKHAVVIMDNASIHKSKITKQLIESRKARLVFVPPYSPEYNPIEMVFGSVKNRFYKQRYKKRFETIKAIHSSVKSIKKQNIVNCFNHVKNLYKEKARTYNHV